MLKLLIPAVILLALAVAGMAVSILFRKNGNFPDGHVGHNKAMKKKGIVCAKTWDRLEQKSGPAVSQPPTSLLNSSKAGSGLPPDPTTLRPRI